MNLVGPIADLLALFKFVRDVGIASRRDEGWEPVQPGHNPIIDLARRDFAGPADNHRHTESALKARSLAAREWRLAAVRPGEVLGAVICRERKNGVAIRPHVLEVLHDRAHDVVE